MPSLTFIARWESADWVPLTYPDPSQSLTSAVYLACLVFFLAFLLLAKAGAAVTFAPTPARGSQAHHA